MADQKKVEEASKGGITVPKPPEGQMMAVVKGNKDGPLDFFVISMKGWHFRYQEYHTDHNKVTEIVEVDKWDLLPDVDPNRPWYMYRPPKADIFEEELGIIFVGPARALRIPSIKYTKWEKPDGKTEFEVVSKDHDESPFFFFHTLMAVNAVKVEIEGNMTVDILVNINLRIMNPYKAEIQAGGWVALINGAIRGTIREHVRQLTFEEIGTQRDNAANDQVASKKVVTKEEAKRELTKQIKKLTYVAPKIDRPEAQHTTPPGDATREDPEQDSGGIFEKFGLEIFDVRFPQFDVSESNDPEVKKALTAKVVNKHLADAAFHKKRELITIGEGEADAAKLNSEAYGSGEAAAAVKQAEYHRDAIMNTTADTIVLGSTGGQVGVNVGGGKNKDKSPRPPKKT